MSKSSSSILESRLKNGYVLYPESIAKRLKKAIEDSGLPMGEIAKKYFKVTYQSVVNLMNGVPECTREETMLDVMHFIEKFEKEDATDEKRFGSLQKMTKAQHDDIHGVRVQKMSYHLLDLEVLAEKMVVIKNIIQSGNIDSDTKVSVIQNVVFGE